MQENYETDIKNGKAALKQEILGLEALVSALGEEFARVVKMFAGLKGRVIVTGMGKSGHIARKIAATFASTGTPAHFVHPAEAGHGDLGMITKDDAVLALSNSGETAELAAIIAYTRRFSIPLVVVVRRAGSMLVSASDIALILPEIPEACETGAPTTSTTMMLALGDAISVALVKRQGFSKHDFSVFHPGGNLGKAFILVSDLMHTGAGLPLVKKSEKMQAVLLAITSKHFGCAGVVDAGGELRGIITDGDLRRHMSAYLLEKTASEVMKEKPLTIRATALAAEALAIMNEKSITSLFVSENNKPIGIIHIHDCLRAGVA